MKIRMLFFSMLTIFSVLLTVFIVVGIVSEYEGEVTVKRSSIEQSTSSRDAHTVPLKYYYRHLRYVEGKVNGRPCNFLFTTGGGETILAEHLFPESSSGTASETIGGVNIDKQRQRYRKQEDISIILGDLTLEHDYVLIKDIEKELPRGLAAIDGIISTKAFQGRILTVDWLERKLIVEDNLPPAITHNALVLDLEYVKSSQEVGLSIFTKMMTPEGALWFEIDNGKMKNVLSFRHSSYIMQHSPHFSHIDQPDAYTVKSVELLELCDTRVRLPVKIEQLTLGDGVLGSYFFRQWQLTFDLKKNRLYCRPYSESEVCL